MRYEPHEYQRYTTEYIETHPMAAVLLDMGLGKTSITLTALNNLLFDSFKVRRILVIAPLRVARNTFPAHTIPIKDVSSIDAIISKADFDRVQEIIRQKSRRAKGAPQEYPLKGLLKCGNCHRTLSRVHSSAGYYYRCTKSKADEASDCPKGKLFSEKEIEGIVFRAVTQMLAMCQERKKQKSSLMLTRKERIAACVAELQKLEQQQERYRQEKFRAYEDFNAGALTKDAYLRQRADIDSKLTSAKAEQDTQEQLLSELEHLAFQDKAQEDDVFTSFAGATELDSGTGGDVHQGGAGVLSHGDRNRLEVPGCVRYAG